jgi:hypothetical protein
VLGTRVEVEDVRQRKLGEAFAHGFALLTRIQRE